MATDYELFTRETVPAFYLQLPSDDPAVIAALVAAGRRAPEDVLLQMLRTDAWRDRKVGAWLAISRPGPVTSRPRRRSRRRPTPDDRSATVGEPDPGIHRMGEAPPPRQE